MSANLLGPRQAVQDGAADLPRAGAAARQEAGVFVLRRIVVHSGDLKLPRVTIGEGRLSCSRIGGVVAAVQRPAQGKTRT